MNQRDENHSDDNDLYLPANDHNTQHTVEDDELYRTVGDGNALDTSQVTWERLPNRHQE